MPARFWDPQSAVLTTVSSHISALALRFSVELNMHPNRQFLAHFVVHTPLCLHVLFRVARPLHSHRGVRELGVFWGMFPWGCEGTAPRTMQGGGVHCHCSQFGWWGPPREGNETTTGGQRQVALFVWGWGGPGGLERAWEVLPIIIGAAKLLPWQICGGGVRKVAQSSPEEVSRLGAVTTDTCEQCFVGRFKGEVLALLGHCVHTAHAEAGILTQVIQLVVTVLFPRNPFQKNEQSKNIRLFMEALLFYRKPRAQDQCFTTKR